MNNQPNYTAAFYGRSAAKRIGWIDNSDWTSSLNCELFPYWQRNAVSFAIKAAHEGNKSLAPVEEMR